MNKNYRKTVSFLAALSMVSASVVLPSAAFADGNGITVNGTTASVTTDKAGVAIVASYDESGRLTAATMKEAAVGTTTLDVKAGDKVMLWDGIGSEQNEPLVEAVKAEAPVPVETEKPTDQPTDKPTDQPTDKPTDQPTDKPTDKPTDQPTEKPTDQPTEKPTTSPDNTAEPQGKTWKFDFGSADNVAEGYTAVPADKVYNNTDGFGLLGLENGFALDSREDGWLMTQGYDLVLENGKKTDNVVSADDDFVATTTRTEKEQPYNSPVRFSMSVEGNTYYKVKVHLTRADASKEAKVSLFTEKRHQHLIDEPIPEEGLVYETSVYVHNNWSKNTKEYVDNQLSVAVLGDNTAISSIEVEQTEQGKTFWILGDSTVCQQTASIPYWPLDHCQGVGSAMPKYIAADWALVNEAESGLSAASSKSHFSNMINDVKPGDMVWFEFGHNDDKVTNDPSTNGYLSTLEEYYNAITEKGANLIVAAPIQRCTAGQYSDGKWSASLAQYGTAAEKYVNDKITAGADNIAYIDLNTLSLGWLNEIQAEVDASRAAASLESLGAETPRFYYFVSKYAGYTNDYTHPNDFGADNFAKLAVNNAKTRIAAAGSAEGTEAVQAAVLEKIFGSASDAAPVRISAEVAAAGKAPNSFYPAQLAKVVLYDYPIIVNGVTFTEDMKPQKMKVKLVASDLTFTYGRAVIEIYDKDKNLKGTVKATKDVIDSVAAETQEVAFDASDVVFDAAAGDTFKAYVKDLDQETFEEKETVISTEYTQNDMIDVKEYLLQGAIGTENKEDFSSYGLADGDTIIGKNGWTNPGGETFAFAKEGELTYAHCSTSGSATYYPEKKFTAVKDGKLYCRMDVRYISGEFNLYFTDGAALNNWPVGRIMPVQIKTDGGEVKVFLNGNAVATINSGEWITFALTIDMDYGTYTLSLNGQNYTADFEAYQSSDAILTPSNLSLIAFQNGKSVNEYDVTNIVLATLNTAELPNRTLKVQSADTAKGTVSIKDYDGTEQTVKMNTVLTAVAEAAEGYSFKDWVDEEGNVVSYSTDYALRLHNDTSIKAEFETEIVDPINYSYKELFSSLSTGTLAGNGWTSTNAQAMITVEQDADHGNYLQFAPGNQNSRGMIKDFGVDLSSDYIVEMDLALTAGSGNAQNTSFSIINTAASNAINDSANNYLFQLDTTNSEEWTVNGGDKVTIPKGTWVHVKLTVGNDGSSVNAVITNGENEIYNGNITAVGGTALKGIHHRSGRYNGIVSMDNIRVYTADQLNAE